MADRTTSSVHTALQPLLQALDTPSFYIELLATGIGITLGWLLSVLLRSYIRRKRRTLHIAHLEWFFKPLKVLTPLLIIFNLAIIQPISAEYTGGNTKFIEGVIGLAVAWLLARVIRLTVRTKPIAYFITTVIFLYAAFSVTGFLQYTSLYLDAMAFSIGKFRLSMLGIIHGVVIFVIVFWLAGTLSRKFEEVLGARSQISYNVRVLVGKLVRIFLYSVAFLITLNSMGVDLTALAVFGGALGVGIGLGLQKLTANFVSGVTILMEKSIKIGDLVEVENNLGWVRQMHMRYALVETFDGREVMIPNEQLLTSRVTNWTYSNEHARIEIRVVISMDSDPVLARELMLAAARAHPKCLRTPEPACHLREFTDLGLALVLSFWIANIRDGRLGPQSDVMFSILQKFRENGVKLAIKAG